MQFDIRTLILVLGITHFIQVAVFSYQYVTNTHYRGIGWWLMWSACEVIGFTCLLLREIPSIRLIAIICQNSMIILGVIFLYIGIMRFFDRKERLWSVALVFTAFLASFLYFILVHDDIVTRGIIIGATLATVSFLTAHALFFYRPPAVIASANLTGAIFLAHGGFFVFRVLMLYKEPIHAKLFVPTLVNVATYMDALVCSILWTFVLIVMINQRLNAATTEAKEEMEMVFNTNPDAAVITRLSDGHIVYANEGFRVLSGFTRDETVGRSIQDIRVWKDPEDRRQMVNQLREKGFVENYESEFGKKDGTLFSGLLSARIISLQGVPHMISVTRDISERKKLEEKIHAASLTDELTGLYNRRGFFTLAQQQFRITERTKKGMLLFFVDLDRMKQINDTLGHQEGDKALVDLATILKEVFRESDIIGRMGGDEFAILAIDTTDETREALKARLQDTLDHYNAPGGRRYTLSLSAGIAHYDPATPSTLDELLARADISMYEEKKRKRY